MRWLEVHNVAEGNGLEDEYMVPNLTESVSLDANELDRIQSEYDVIFVVAGTNIPAGAVCG